MIFLFIYITILWVLILLGGFILVNLIAKIELEDIYLESLLKGGIAIGMCILWIFIIVKIKDIYMRTIK
jgi:hypothetical protein